MEPARVSLLTPTRAAFPLLRLDWVALAAVFLLAWVARWAIAGSHPYTAEAAHYIVAKNLWTSSPSYYTLYNDLHGDLMPLFWQRPFFSLALAPGAWISFEGYRVLHLTLASLLPVLAVALLVQMGTRRWLAWPVGLVLALHPLIVPWGTLVLPDSLMAVLSLAGLLAAHQGRPLLMGAFLLAACWTKEVAIVTVLPLAAFAWWRDPDGTQNRLWPLQLGRFPTVLAAVLVLAFAPLLYSLSRGAGFPGWGVGGDGSLVLEKVFLVVWLAPLLLLGLASPVSRRLALLGVAWSGFFLAYRFVLGRAVEAWYVVLPATLVLMAVAAGLSQTWERLPAPRRLAVPLLAVAVAGLLAFQIAAPDAHPLKAPIVTPLSGTAQWSLEQAIAFEQVREDHLYEVLAMLTAADTSLLTVDVDWSFVAYPLQGLVETVYMQDGALTTLWRFELGPLVDGIENRTDATLVHKVPNAVNEAIRSVYQDCVIVDNPDYVLLRGAGCKGRAAAFEQAVYGTG